MARLAGLLSELGYHHVTSSHSLTDVWLLFASRFVRLFAFGAAAPILVLHLRLLGFPDKAVGLFLSLTLLGDVLLSLGVTWVADHVGRRRVLALGALLMGVSGIVFATSESYSVLLGAAIVGIVSPSGNEVGPFSALEVGVLSQLVEPDARVYVLMWYQVLGFIGTAFGSFAAGAIVSSLEQRGRSLIDCYRAVFLVYGFVAVLKVVLSLQMSIYTELEHPSILVKVVPAAAQVDPERQLLLDATSTAIAEEQVDVVDNTAVETPSHPLAFQPLPLLRLAYLCILFSMDSFASSLIPTSFVAYYFQLRFNASVAIITRTFGAAAIIGGLSQLLAGSIARRAGIIMTMVGTHMPAQILTAALAIAPTLSAGLAIFLARSTIGSMDASVRGAFLSAIVPKASRTRFLGIVNVCKSLASAPGPNLSGVLASWGGLRWSFVICACVKLTYDTGLLIGFKTAKLEH